ncbi:Protein Skeletor, isoforms D/E [Frankliniella fusca]|uniref:Protein Skeletor, isoforms D/E n=1 Tax=Frankliniella fusca TaxID=407009 RepID=A0AAE1H6R0_9NEOP|nr:Protein Skeletor, isoforms D/E [Frankliniella fusca]
MKWCRGVRPRRALRAAVRHGLHGLLQVQIQTQSEAQAQAEAQAEAQSQSPPGSQAQADPTTLYDHLKEETAKQDKQEPSAAAAGAKPSAQLPLQQLQQQQLAAAAVGLLSGPGPAYLSHGLLGPSMMHPLKYIPHHPTHSLPVRVGLAGMTLGGPVPLGGPLTRPLAAYGKHKVPHGMTPLSMHSHRHGLPSGMIRRPVLGHTMSPAMNPAVLLQQQAARPGMIMASPSQHNYVIKKKPHFRVPTAGLPAAMLTSTTLRPLYLPTTAGLYSSTLRPTLAQSIMVAQAQAHAQAQAQAVAASQQQIYATKLQKLAAALSTSTTTTTTTTTTPAPVSIPAHLPRPAHLSPQHANHHPSHHSHHHANHQPATNNHASHHHSLQSYPAYYRPSSNPSYPPVSPAFDLESPLEKSPSLNFGSLAVNTGFNPSSVVVEGGFKPILQRRQDEAEDRMAFVEGGDDGDDFMEGSVVEMERRSSDVAVEDEDFVDDDGVQEQPLQQERRTETFEPMFIPSPPDRNSFKAGSVAGKKASEPGKSLVKPKQGGKQARRDKPARLTPLIVRPRPAILGRPLYPNMVMPPFRIQAQARRGHRENIEDDDDDDDDDEEDEEIEHLPIPEHLHQDPATTTGTSTTTAAAQKDDKLQERNQDEEDVEAEDDNVQDETMMAAERMDTYYLPPSAPQQHNGHQQQGLPHTIVTYDGKAVDAAIAASIPNPPPESPPHSPSSADLVRGTPQFGPFLGEAPPPIPAAPSPLDLPQLQPQQVQQAPLAQYPPLLPLSAPAGDEQGLLALVQVHGPHHGTHSHEDTLQTASTDHRGHHQGHAADEHGSSRRQQQQQQQRRRRRSPHHEPGHEGYDDEHDAAGKGAAAPGAAPAGVRAGCALTLLCAMLVSALSAGAGWRLLPC